eukprot:TRINITY_DN4584_c0_g1_i3.p1 TRINITY_DN4584_c0_g1~~TRINITY_DN4584_c0_g1_i3.p1  ORF type:complete len:759 (+),score=187.54 TRINITY_DN4584_c0_g1_i3:1629-3905(+)
MNVAGGAGLALGYHGSRRQGMRVNLLDGSAGSSNPLSEHRKRHGWLMTAAWCFFAPLSVGVKRYGKRVYHLRTSPGKPGLGLFLHMFLALSAVACTYGGAAVAAKHWWTVGTVSVGVQHGHSEVAHLMILLAALQPCVGMLGVLLCPRNGLPGRVAFVFLHRGLGWSLLLLGIVQCTLGLKNIKRTDPDAYNDLLVAACTGLAASFAVMGALELVLLRSIVMGKEHVGESREDSDQPFFSIQDVQQHMFVDDVWVILKNSVYDVTELLGVHPGGPQLVLDQAGTDATVLFLKVGHSAEAHKMMAAFRIGGLEESRSASAIRLTEDMANLMVAYDLTSAECMLAFVKDTLPERLHAAFSDMIENLKSYKPYLPQALLDAFDTTSNACGGSEAGSDSGGDIGSPAAFATSLSYNNKSSSKASPTIPALTASVSRRISNTHSVAMSVASTANAEQQREILRDMGFKRAQLAVLDSVCFSGASESTSSSLQSEFDGAVVKAAEAAKMYSGVVMALTTDGHSICWGGIRKVSQATLLGTRAAMHLTEGGSVRAAGLCKDSAWYGACGSQALKFTISIGRPEKGSKVLSRLAAFLKCSLLVPDTAATDLQHFAHWRPVDRIYGGPFPGPVRVMECTGMMTHGDEEWMYQISAAGDPSEDEEAARKKHWRQLFKAVCRNNVTDEIREDIQRYIREHPGDRPAACINNWVRSHVHEGQFVRDVHDDPKFFEVRTGEVENMVSGTDLPFSVMTPIPQASSAEVVQDL